MDKYVCVCVCVPELEMFDPKSSFNDVDKTDNIMRCRFVWFNTNYNRIAYSMNQLVMFSSIMKFKYTLFWCIHVFTRHPLSHMGLFYCFEFEKQN